MQTQGITHQHLLRAMAVLETKRGRFDRAISAWLRPLIGHPLSVVFYDLTTLHTHGEMEKVLRLVCTLSDDCWRIVLVGYESGSFDPEGVRQMGLSEPSGQRSMRPSGSSSHCYLNYSLHHPEQVIS